MFNSICLHGRQTSDPNKPIDLGFLAETMLFYKKVYLIADNSMLEQLIGYCGAQLVWELINEGFLTINYLETDIVIGHFNDMPNLFFPASIAPPVWKLQEVLSQAFQKISRTHGESRKLSNRLAEHIRPVNINDQEIIKGIQEDFAHKEYIKKAAALVLRALAPDYQLPPHFKFTIKKVNASFEVATNLDFVSTSKGPRLQTPGKLTTISPETLLMFIAGVKRELHISCLLEGEIATNVLSSQLIQAKCEELLNTRIKNENNIKLFQDMILNNGHAIREAINSNEKNYRDLIQLLKRARRLKFQHWLENADPDANLVKEYLKEITTSTWAEKLPTKLLRWAVLTGLGIGLLSANPIVGTAISGTTSFVDSFVIDKLAQGWKPNQFVEGHLKPFIG